MVHLGLCEWCPTPRLILQPQLFNPAIPTLPLLTCTLQTLAQGRQPLPYRKATRGGAEPGEGEPQTESVLGQGARRCAECGVRPAELQTCGKCRVATYCNR